MMLAIAVGAGGQGWTWSVTIAVAVAGTMSVSPTWIITKSVIVSWLLRLFMVAAIAFGIALIVDGVYAV